MFVPDHGPSTPPELQAAVDKQQAVKARISLPGAGRHAEVQFRCGLRCAALRCAVPCCAALRRAAAVLRRAVVAAMDPAATCDAHLRCRALRASSATLRCDSGACCAVLRCVAPCCAVLFRDPLCRTALRNAQPVPLPAAPAPRSPASLQQLEGEESHPLIGKHSPSAACL